MSDGNRPRAATILIKRGDAEICRLADADPPRMGGRTDSRVVAQAKGLLGIGADPDEIRCVGCGRLLGKWTRRGDSVLDIRCGRCGFENKVGHRSVSGRKGL